MSKAFARTLSYTFAPALIALVGISGSALCAIEPQDTPAKPTVVDATSDCSAGHAHSCKAGKHHQHHRFHKGQTGRKRS